MPPLSKTKASSSENVCRVCLSRDGVFLDLFGSKTQNVSYAEEVNKCLSFQATQDDGLPSKICVKCVGLISDCIPFVDKVNKLKEGKSGNERKSSSSGDLCFYCLSSENYLFPISENTSNKTNDCFSLKTPTDEKVCHRCQYFLDTIHDLKLKACAALKHFYTTSLNVKQKAAKTNKEPVKGTANISKDRSTVDKQTELQMAVKVTLVDVSLIIGADLLSKGTINLNEFSKQLFLLENRTVGNEKESSHLLQSDTRISETTASKSQEINKLPSASKKKLKVTFKTEKKIEDSMESGSLETNHEVKKRRRRSTSDSDSDLPVKKSINAETENSGTNDSPPPLKTPSRTRNVGNRSKALPKVDTQRKKEGNQKSKSVKETAEEGNKTKTKAKSLLNESSMTVEIFDNLVNSDGVGMDTSMENADAEQNCDVEKTPSKRKVDKILKGASSGEPSENVKPTDEEDSFKKPFSVLENPSVKRGRGRRATNNVSYTESGEGATSPSSKSRKICEEFFAKQSPSSKRKKKGKPVPDSEGSEEDEPTSTSSTDQKKIILQPAFIRELDELLKKTPKSTFKPFICSICHEGYISTTKGKLHKLLVHDPQSKFVLELKRCDEEGELKRIQELHNILHPRASQSDETEKSLSPSEARLMSCDSTLSEKDTEENRAEVNIRQRVEDIVNGELEADSLQNAHTEESKDKRDTEDINGIKDSVGTHSTDKPCSQEADSSNGSQDAEPLERPDEDNVCDKEGKNDEMLDNKSDNPSQSVSIKIESQDETDTSSQSLCDTNDLPKEEAEKQTDKQNSSCSDEPDEHSEGEREPRNNEAEKNESNSDVNPDESKRDSFQTDKLHQSCEAATPLDDENPKETDSDNKGKDVNVVSADKTDLHAQTVCISEENPEKLNDNTENSRKSGSSSEDDVRSEPADISDSNSHIPSPPENEKQSNSIENENSNMGTSENVDISGGLSRESDPSSDKEGETSEENNDIRHPHNKTDIVPDSSTSKVANCPLKTELESEKEKAVKSSEQEGGIVTAS